MFLERNADSEPFCRAGEGSSRTCTLEDSVEHCDEKSMLSVWLEMYKVYLISLTLALVGLLCCSGWYSTATSLNFEEYLTSPLENLM